MNQAKFFAAILFIGLKKDFGYKKLKKSYKDKCKELHPDCGGNSDDFQVATDYYRFLSEYLEAKNDLQIKDIECPACKSSNIKKYSFCYHCSGNGYTRSIKKNSNGIPISLSKKCPYCEIKNKIGSICNLCFGSKKISREELEKYILSFNI